MDGMHSLNDSGQVYLEFTWRTGRGSYLLLSQPATALYHLNPMIQNDPDCCAASFYLLSAGGPAKMRIKQCI